MRGDPQQSAPMDYVFYAGSGMTTANMLELRGDGAKYRVVGRGLDGLGFRRQGGDLAAADEVDPRELSVGRAEAEFTHR